MALYIYVFFVFVSWTASRWTQMADTYSSHTVKVIRNSAEQRV